MTRTSQPLATAHELHVIAERVRDIARRNGREELTTRIDEVYRTLADTDIRVVVVGQFKQGKSALVNALVSAPVCPVDDVVATSVPTVVRWGEQAAAALVTEIDHESQTVRSAIDPSQLRQHVTELARESGLLGNLHAEVTLPRAILADGFSFVDTPGVGRAQARVSTNLTLLPQADAAIMVTDATQELTEPELGFLQQAVALCPRVTCVVSKSDLQHHWREIVAANIGHLRSRGVDVPVLVTSALLHEVAKQESDTALRDEARIDALAAYLREKVRVDTLGDRHRAAAEDIRTVGEHLVMVIEAELQALDHPGDGEVIDNLKLAEENAGRLVHRSARWQQTLSDGAGDLVSDIEFDLRDRLRAVGREADRLISASDPGKVWDDVGTWLAESVTQAVSDNFVWAHQRSIHLAEVVAKHFSIDGKTSVPDLQLTGAQHVIGAIGGLDVVQPGRLSLGQKVMVGLKGSYGGILMFGLMTTLAGMALVNPISIAAGVIMGGFAYRQDANQRLEQRRAEARGAVRKLIDESIFQVGKESRDRMSRVKRVLRDHFIGVAEELRISLNESTRMAKRSAKLAPAERGDRAAALAAELKTIRALTQRAIDLTRADPVPQIERKTA